MRDPTMNAGPYTIDAFGSVASPFRHTEAYDAVITIAGLGGSGALSGCPGRTNSADLRVADITLLLRLS
jgi:hypothetical protein